VALLPTLISAGFLRGVIANAIDDSIEGSAEFDGLSLGWFSGITVTNFTILDPKGEVVLVAPSIEAPDAGLLGLVTGNLDLGVVTIRQPRATVVQDAQGNVNLLQALESSSPASTEEGPLLPEGMKVRLELVDGQASFRSANLPAVQAQGVNLTADLTD